MARDSLRSLCYLGALPGGPPQWLRRACLRLRPLGRPLRPRALGLGLEQAQALELLAILLHVPAPERLVVVAVHHPSEQPQVRPLGGRFGRHEGAALDLQSCRIYPQDVGIIPMRAQLARTREVDDEVAVHVLRALAIGKGRVLAAEVALHERVQVVAVHGALRQLQHMLADVVHVPLIPHILRVHPQRRVHQEVQRPLLVLERPVRLAALARHGRAEEQFLRVQLVQEPKCPGLVAQQHDPRVGPAPVVGQDDIDARLLRGNELLEAFVGIHHQGVHVDDAQPVEVLQMAPQAQQLAPRGRSAALDGLGLQNDVVSPALRVVLSIGVGAAAHA
eukprot:scaffold8510_cov239-Pinguiococcus_pyrenoidosus.AAC.2